MADSIKTITDKTQFKHILDKYFSGANVFLKTKSGDLNVQYLGYTEDNVAFRIPRVKNVPDTLIIFTRINNNTIYASLKYIENNEDTFIFIPVKFQIISQARKEERSSFDTGDSGKNVLFISNISSDYLIQNSLMTHEKKIDNIKESLRYDLQQKFERIRINFIHEVKVDPRMKHAIEKMTPVFIADLNEKPEEKYERMFNYYVNEIYSKDYKLANEKDFISEVTVPILYRNIIPFGYIQVNNTRPMTEGYLSVIKRMAIVINEALKKDNMIEPIMERFLVSDLSRGGLGIVFKDRRKTRFFRQGSLLCFDMMLPTSKKVVLSVIARNVSFLDNGIIKVGFEIKEMDAISQVNFDEYMDSIKS